MSKRKILVVDDDREILQLLSAQLGRHGYEVVWAADGVGAISSARKEQPDLIVLDLGLPAGDGFVCLDRLKRSVELGPIPVIVLTGREGSDALAQRVRKGGATSLVEKTAGTEVLVEEIQRQIPSALAS